MEPSHYLMTDGLVPDAMPLSAHSPCSVPAFPSAHLPVRCLIVHSYIYLPYFSAHAMSILLSDASLSAYSPTCQHAHPSSTLATATN